MDAPPPAPHPAWLQVARDAVTPYSGMLPGFVSGFYSHSDVHSACRADT